jgi:hypothetical protein
MGLRIGKGFGQQRRVAKLFEPLPGQGATGRRQHLGGQIGFGALVVEQQIAPVLDHQLEPFGPLGGRPTNPDFAIL